MGKKVYIPPSDIQSIASAYEAETTDGKIYVYRFLSPREIRDYYTGRNGSIEPDEQGRVFLFIKESEEEVDKIISSYWTAARKLLNFTK